MLRTPSLQTRTKTNKQRVKEKIAAATRASSDKLLDQEEKLIRHKSKTLTRGKHYKAIELDSDSNRDETLTLLEPRSVSLSRLAKVQRKIQLQARSYRTLILVLLYLDQLLTLYSTITNVLTLLLSYYVFSCSLRISRTFEEGGNYYSRSQFITNLVYLHLIVVYLLSTQSLLNQYIYQFMVRSRASPYGRIPSVNLVVTKLVYLSLIHI